MASLRWTPDTRRRVLMCCSDQHVQAAFTEVYVERDVIDVAVRCYLCQNWMELNSQDSTDEEGDSSQDNGHGDGDHHEEVFACETEFHEPEPDAFGVLPTPPPICLRRMRITRKSPGTAEFKVVKRIARKSSVKSLV